MRLVLGTLLICLSAMPQQPAAKASLADFAWMEGRWVGEAGERKFKAEETYSSPAGGVILTMFRLMDGEKTLVVELATFTEGKDGLELRLRHFDTALKAFEKEDPITLRLTEHDGKRWVFTNFVHQQPKRVVLTRNSADEFHSRSEIVNKDGSERAIELTMRRAK